MQKMSLRNAVVGGGKIYATLVTLSLVGGLTLGAPARGDVATPDQEVIVTAQRRSQSVQDVAISMEAFSDQQLKDRGINNVLDLAEQAPNIHFNSYFEVGKPQISIRGISISNLFTNFEQSPVGIYYDDVFIGSRSGQMSQMFDEERVEVLRGPQGTLFGRNTTAGAISLVSKKPGDQFEADSSVTFGRWSEFDIDGGVTMPLSDTLSMRVAGIKRQRDGWEKNLYPGGQQNLDDVDNWGTRALLLWKPSGDVSWLLNIHASGDLTNTPVIHADLGTTGQNTPNLYTGYKETGAWDTVSTNYPFKEKLHGHGAALTGTMKFGEYTLTSITGYERTDYTEQDDDDGSPYQIAPILTRDITSTYSEELRLAAKKGRFDWVVGAFYYHEDLWQEYHTQSFTDPLFAGQGLAIYLDNYPTQTSYNYAGFGDLRTALADTWTLDVGARFTHEQKHFVGSAFQNLPDFNTGYFQTIGGPTDPLSVRDPSWNAPTGRVALEWKLTPATLNYLSYSHGFKSGGVNGLAFNSSQELTPYNPEKVDTYEYGLKSSWLGGKVVVNGALFYNKLDNMQALVVDVSHLIPLFFVRNAATGTSKGGELELKARPDRHWILSLGLGYADGKYDKFILPNGTDLSGNEFVAAPKETVTASVQYRFDFFGGSLAPHVEASYQSHVWFDVNNRPGIDYQGGYTLLDAGIPWRTADAHWEVAAWGHNLTDKHYFLSTIGNGVGNYGAAVSYHALPRSYGVTFSYYYQ